MTETSGLFAALSAALLFAALAAWLKLTGRVFPLGWMADRLNERRSLKTHPGYSRLPSA